MENFLIEIIKQTKQELLNNVDEKYQEELLRQYEEILKRQFRGLKVKTEYYDEALRNEISINNKLLSKMGAEEKLSLYIQDKAYEKLSILSNEGLELGLRRYNEGKILDMESAEKSKEQMKKQLKKVREFNQIQAQTIYGDGILDYNYACGASEVFSLRLGHLIPRRNIEEEER